MKFSHANDLPYLKAAAQSLHDENARLRAELQAQQAEFAKVLEAKAEAEGRLQEASAQHQAEIARLEAELRNLKELLDLRNKALFGRKTERRAAEDNPENEPGSTKPKKEKKKQKGHGPTPQPLLPVVEVTHGLTEDARACESCGTLMAPLGTAAEEAELIAIEERRIVLEKHLRTKYQCPCCHTGVKVAPGPLKLIPGGRYALSFAVDVAFAKYFAHLPLERQAQMMKHEGLRVTTVTLFDQVDLLATTLTPTYQAILRIVQAELVLRADETPWNVLSNGHTKNEKFYAWVAVGQEYVAFCLLDTRSKEGAATVLGSFAGTLMVDGLTSYPAAAKGEPGEAPRFKVANCHAHARRKFVECEAHYPEESRFAVELYRRLYEIEREGKDPGADLAVLRDSKSRALIEELFTWAKAQQARSDLLPSSGLAKAIAYLINHEEGLRIFLDDAAVPIDNNESERALRALVVGRKNHLGSRSRRGTETAAILYTLVESARRLGLNPKAYILAAAEYALTRPGAILLPQEFKRQLEAVASDTA